MVNDGFSIGLIGFIGGIIGAVIVNRITYLLQKKSKKKEQIENYKDELKEYLIELCDIWDDYRVSIYYDSDAIFQMKGEIHTISREFTKITSSRYSCFLHSNINGELRELSASLTDTLSFITKEKVNDGTVDEAFDEICHRAYKIKNKIEKI